jgi:hypothetical protein
VFSISEVKDLEGRAVLHERLLLPFSDEGTVTQVVASLKSISIEGKFHNEMLLSPNEARSYLVRAVISNASRPAGNVVADDVVADA